ncbi:hypothetical protein [Streptomyces sp. TLI_146]|uniref:hypothetical protein n=1 Tax=Streptomyces sp. TLI_146 TaxID=1938858 RepID=UPI000CA7B344|nr:hypothetical protein [Streptomyces sp. TLI_146]PKV84306.1 hypothetical protein BX283_1822 [Streptomyces sp. TLI_146]
MALAATACSSGSDSPEAKNPAPSASADKQRELPPALTKQQALAAIDRYSQVNNKANADADTALLDSVEDGPMYAMSVSEFKESEGLTASERKAYKPWAYDTQNAQLYIPRIADGQPRWFAAALSDTPGKAPSRLAVFAEQPQHKRWEMVSAADLYGTDLPKVALDTDGYATAVAAKSNKDLAVGADQLREGVLDNFATGGQNSGKKTFTESKTSSLQIKVHDETVTQYGSQGTSTFTGATHRYGDAYALKTTDGGTLVFFSHTHTQTDAVARHGLQLNPGKDDRAWLHDIPRSSIQYTFVCNDAATVPAKSAPSTLLAYTCARTDASGPPVNSASLPRV